MRDFTGGEYSRDPDYRLIKHQIEQMKRMKQQIHFGSKVNILLVAEELEACRAGLKEYLENSTDITVYSACVTNDARSIIKSMPFDFMIIVEAFRSKMNYHIVESFEYFNKYAFTILYTGMTNPDLQTECTKYGIFHTYSKHDRLEGLISTMQELYAISTERVNEFIAQSALKSHIWNQLLPNLDDYTEAAPDDESERDRRNRKLRENRKRIRLRRVTRGGHRFGDSPEIVKARLDETMNIGIDKIIRHLTWFHRMNSVGLLSE